MCPVIDIRLPIPCHRTTRRGPVVRLSDGTRERLRAIRKATGNSYDAIVFAALAATFAPTEPRDTAQAR